VAAAVAAAASSSFIYVTAAAAAAVSVERPIRALPILPQYLLLCPHNFEYNFSLYFNYFPL